MPKYTNEEPKVLREMTKRLGTYTVAKMLSEVANETAREFLSVGNDGAIIHSDAAELDRAVKAMQRSHPLRFLSET